jgi:hypothetical protein
MLCFPFTFKNNYSKADRQTPCFGVKRKKRKKNQSTFFRVSACLPSATLKMKIDASRINFITYNQAKDNTYLIIMPFPVCALFNNFPIPPNFAEKGPDKNYKCVECCEDVVLCQGKVIRPYFRHKEKKECDFYEKPSESQIHLSAKHAILHLIHHKKRFIVNQKCIKCDEVVEYTFEPENPVKSCVEYEFRLATGQQKRADVAYIEGGELCFLFEVFHSHRTKEWDRPEPWAELSAIEVMTRLSELEPNDAKGTLARQPCEISFDCMRHRECDACKAERERKYNEWLIELSKREAEEKKKKEIQEFNEREKRRVKRENEEKERQEKEKKEKEYRERLKQEMEKREKEWEEIKRLEELKQSRRNVLTKFLKKHIADHADIYEEKEYDFEIIIYPPNLHGKTYFRSCQTNKIYQYISDEIWGGRCIGRFIDGIIV